jgi:ubiquinone/menaquinone biosynthesis C-methylase UbiE
MGSWARHYDLMMVLITFGREGKLRQLTLDLAQIQPGDRVLEIGCGTGTLTLAAKVRVGASGEVAGIDIAPEMVGVASRKAARKGLDASFQVASVERIPFTDNHFDAVVCSFMIFHMPESVRSRGLAEIRRVLKPGGRLFILDLVLPGRLGHHHHHVRELVPVLKQYSFGDIEMAKAGFMGTWFVRAKAGKAQISV